MEGLSGVVQVLLLALPVVGMNLLFGARTNWGKSFGLAAYVERNAPEYDCTVLIDYKDEYTGLVESGLLKRLPVPQHATALSRADWRAIFEANGSLQLARDGLTGEAWRETMATAVAALAETDRTVFVGLDEAHRLAPQGSGYPDAWDTLATTWHGDGMGVAWVTQRMAKLDKDVVSEAQASMLGGFRSGADLDQIAKAVEYPKEVHKDSAERVSRSLPDALLVDGEPLTLRRFTDDAGHTVGSEWVYSDDTTLRRIDSREWELQSTHYGSDRKRIKHPFDA